MSDEIDKNLVNERLKIDFQFYRQTLSFLELNVPISVLCLGTAFDNLLKKEGINRVYDLTPFRDDFSKIKGLGKTRVDRLTASFYEFVSI